MSKKYPIDMLTEQDKQDLFRYIDRGLSMSADPVIVKKMLEDWSHNKGTIFRALGNQLRVEVELTDIDQYKYERRKRIVELGINYFIYNKEHLEDFWGHYSSNGVSNIFCINYLIFVAQQCLKEQMISWEEAQGLIELQRDEALISGQTIQEISLSNFKLKIPRGTKVMRAFQKVLKTLGASDTLMSDFEQFRNQISNISTTLSSMNNATLVFSIHPLDIMSLSDNDCGWHSCFSWIGEGEYRNSCLEMMTSNLTLVAYLKAKKDFVVDPHGTPITLPNKSYRQLCYLHKDILLVGKGYPYQDKKLSLKILDKLNDLVYNNLKWKYQFRNQQYKEMDHMDDDYGYHFEKYHHSNGHHQIFMLSEGQIYNDLALYHDGTGYWCNRNKVEKNLYLNISGPSYCLNCGDTLQGDEAGNGLCDDCHYTHYCDDCGTSYSSGDNFTYINRTDCNYGHVCDDCIEERYLYDTVNNEWKSKDYIAWDYRYANDIPNSEFDYDLFDYSCNGRYITPEEWSEKCLAA